MALSLIGIVMIASLSLRNTPAGGNPYGLTLKQIQYLGLGMTAMLCCYLTPLGLLRRTGWLLWMLAVLLTMGTLIPGLGVRVGGARRWLELGSARFQPLELLTIAVPLFLADRLALTNRKDLKAFLSPTLFIALVSVLPLLLQPNLGGTILVLVICLSMHVENRGWKYPLLGGGLLAVLFVFLIWMEPYRTRRFWAFLDPWEDPMGKGFQIIQGLVAFCNGGFLGVGIAKGLQESDYLPAAETDYIFPAIGEEFGLVGTLFILGLYAIWCLRVYSLYRRTSDPYLSSLIWGMAISVLAPMFINLSGVMKLMPLTGIPLPFVSAGGSSLLFMWGKIGILMLINKSLIKSQERRVG
ncbi:MAG: FtsW/RodA/SpoVE family cell cycle protein [Fretibacterium sp.]|nr:FtsW/RodA/SpoVE family cell cycle protein [Fretibacterium sp.]